MLTDREIEKKKKNWKREYVHLRLALLPYHRAIHFVGAAVAIAFYFARFSTTIFSRHFSCSTPPAQQYSWMAFLLRLRELCGVFINRWSSAWARPQHGCLRSSQQCNFALAHSSAVPQFLCRSRCRSTTFAPYSFSLHHHFSHCLFC